MADGRIEYKAKGLAEVTCTLVAPKGAVITVSGAVDASAPDVAGSAYLRANPALVSNLWAFAKHEAQYRRLRAPEVRKSHAKQKREHAKQALAIAAMVERLGSKTRSGWCSGCFTRSTHREVLGYARPYPAYLCTGCGSPTTTCAVVKCPNLANRRVAATSAPRYCAEHRHDVPGFEKLVERLDSIDECATWLTFEKRNIAKATKLTGLTLGTGIVLAPLAFLSAPAIGGAIGAYGSGLSGAAATSHGLALLGGGALAAGGAGMAGGTLIITGAGAGLGGAFFAVITSSYVRSDKSFRIEKLQAGEGTPVILANGFLTEGKDGWADWQPLIDQRYPAHPVYRLHWGAKELKAIGLLTAQSITKQAAHRTLKGYAAKASTKAAQMSGIGPLLLASDLARNPWSVAKHRAAMTGAVLADLIARTNEPRFILVGHSLGGRVMVTAAQALGTKQSGPKIETVHLLGAAVGAKGDWRTLNDAVTDRVWNYWSKNDKVLKYFYRTAQANQLAAGSVGFGSKFPRISDQNVSPAVATHSAYFRGVSLR